MAGRSLNFYNLTGGLNTVQDLYTINSTPNRTETPKMVNIDYYKLGGIKTMLGNKQIAPQFTDSGSITCGYEYQLDNVLYLIITTSTGRCYQYNNTTKTFSQFYKFNSTTERHSMVEFASGLVITNGQDQMIYYKPDREDELVGTVSGTIENADTEAKLTITKDKKTETENITLALTVGDRVKIGDYYYWVTNVQPEITNEEGDVTTQASVSVIIVDFLNENQTSSTEPTYPITITNSKVQYTGISRIAAYLTNTDEANPIDPIPINGLAIAAYKGRLWVGNTDGRLLYSELGLYNGWDIKYDAGAFENFEEDGSNFTGLANWSEYLICHKKQNTYILDANNDDSTQWSIKPYSENTCYSQQSMLVCNEGYFIYSDISTSVLPLLSRSIYNTTYQGKDISVKIRDSFNYLDITKLDKIFACYYPKKQYLMFYMPFQNGNGYSNKCYIYDLLTKSWLYRELPQKITCAFTYDNEVYIGTEDGYVLKEFESSSFNGEPIQFEYTTPSFIWGGGINNVTTSEFRVKLLNETSNNFYIETIRNGYKVSKDKRLINTNKDNGVSLVWDIGLNLGDRAITVPIVTNIYHYHAKVNGEYIYKKDEEGKPTEVLKDYYTLEPITAGSLGIDVYSEPDLNQESYLGKNQNIYEEGPGNNVEYNRIEYQTAKMYGWCEKNLERHCYQSTVDPRIKAWVHIDDTTRALVNVKSALVYDFIEIQLSNAVRFRVREWMYNELNTKKKNKTPSNFTQYNTVTNQGDCYFYNTQSGQWETGLLNIGILYNWVPTIYTNGPQNGAPPGYVLGVPLTFGQYLDDGINVLYMQATGSGYQYVNKGEFNAWKNTNENIPMGPATTQKVTEVWNGRDDSNGALTKIVEYYSEEYITIDGVRYNRYEAGDYGENKSLPKYTEGLPPRPGLEVGDPIYNDTSKTSQYSTVRGWASDNTSYITCEVDSEVVFLYRDENNDSTTEVPTYYYDRQVEFVDEEVIQSERKPESFYPPIPHPEKDPPQEGSALWYQSLTDTIWDWMDEDRPNNEYGDLWSGQGYLSKRFLLSDQYFETVQFSFFGTSSDNAMTLCGFEIDGIQLTEVPH